MKKLDSKKVYNYLMRKIKKEDFKQISDNRVDYSVYVSSKNEGFIFDIATQYGDKPKFFYISLIGVNEKRGLRMYIDLEKSQVEKLTKAISISSAKKNKREEVRASQAAYRERLRKQKLILKELDSIV
jgi:hypothetical protein